MTPGDAFAVTLGKEIRRRRKLAGLTLEQLAEKAQLTENYVGSIERGQRDPSLSTVQALAKALKVTPGELLGGPNDLSPQALEAATLFAIVAPEMQEAVLAVLRAAPKRRR